MCNHQLRNSLFVDLYSMWRAVLKVSNGCTIYIIPCFNDNKLYNSVASRAVDVYLVLKFTYQSDGCLYKEETTLANTIIKNELDRSSRLRGNSFVRRVILDELKENCRRQGRKLVQINVGCGSRRSGHKFIY